MAFRQSKYKHVKGQTYRVEAQYPQLSITQSSGDNNIISASCNFIATTWQSSPLGSIGILGLDECGRRKGNVPLIVGHNGQITDLAWNPFHDWVLGTSSMDGTVKIWKLPEFGLKENMTAPQTSISVSDKCVETLAWNPTGYNVLAAGGSEGRVSIYDMNTGKANLEISEWDASIDSISWNYNGTLLSTVSRDKKLRVLDVRAKTVLYETEAHEGVGKPMRSLYLGNLGKILTTGFSKMRDTQVFIWDERALKKPLLQQNFGASPGVITPLFDSDTNLLFLTSRGDCSLRVYEVGGDSSSASLFELTSVVDKNPHRGVCLIPKRSCMVMSCEVARVLRATNNSIVPVGFQVPRKTYMDFHADLFPDTPGPDPALSTQEWFDGQTKNPILVSLNPEIENNSSDNTEDAQDEKIVPYDNGTKTFNVFDTHSKKEVVEEYVLPDLKIVRSTRFRYITGNPAMKINTYENLKVLNEAMQNRTIDGNNQWIGITWQGIGGRLAIFNVDKDKGRAPTDISTIETGGAVMDFTFNKFNPNVLVSGGDNSHIKVWTIPESGVRSLKSNLTTPTADLLEHNHRIVSLDFHPLASNVLLSTSADLSMKLWDLNKSSSQVTLTGFNDLISSTSWNYDGSLLGASSKDGKVRFWDARANKIISESDDIGGVLGTKIAWLGNQDRVAYVGYDKNAERVVKVVDMRNPTADIGFFKLGHGSGALTPHYDADTGVLALWSKGEGTVRFLEINDEAPYIHPLTDYSTNIPQVGVAFLPKTTVNVRNVEIMKVYKLALDKIVPISFTVPRVRKEFFQDDIFPDTISDAPTLTSESWFSGETTAPLLKSLQPSDMKKLSEAPKQENVRRRVVVDTSEEFDIEKVKTELVDKFYANMETYQEGKSLPGDDMEGCDSDEWDD